jgi:peroxiredoxin
VILSDLHPLREDLEARTGWRFEELGARKGDRFVALPSGRTTVYELADALGMPVVHDERHELWALGPEVAPHSLAAPEAPDFSLPNVAGEDLGLQELRGQKVLLVVWAPWGGCRFDLPAWQALREELYPRGLEIVTVALDVTGGDALPWIERAAPSHPSLIDTTHLLVERYGLVNVPSGVWIDEGSLLVRPPEPAFPARPHYLDAEPPPDAPEELRARWQVARDIRVEPERYVAALRDWVERGRASPAALTPEEVVARSRPRPVHEATAAAHFELGQFLWRSGYADHAVEHFRESHRLHPENWAYKRQAWHLDDPVQGPSPYYDGDWLTDVRRIGAENYYPPLDL